MSMTVQHLGGDFQYYKKKIGKQKNGWQFLSFIVIIIIVVFFHLDYTSSYRFQCGRQRRNWVANRAKWTTAMRMKKTCPRRVTTKRAVGVDVVEPKIAKYQQDGEWCKDSRR